MNQTFDTFLEFDESAVFGQTRHSAGDFASHGVPARYCQPWIRIGLFETERNPLSIDLENHHLQFLVHLDNLAGVSDMAPGHIVDMKKTVNSTEVDKCAEISEVLDTSLNPAPFLQLLHGFFTESSAFFFEESALRENQVSLTAHLDDFCLDCLPDKCLLLFGGAGVRSHLRERNESTQTVNIDLKSTFQDLLNDTLDRRSRFEGFSGHSLCPAFFGPCP